MNQLVQLPTAAGDLATEHLQAEHWARANRLLVKKALAEFSHEKLLRPEPLGDSPSRVPVPDSSIEYHFQARSQNGRASCRGRVCQYVFISLVASTIKKQKTPQ